MVFELEFVLCLLKNQCIRSLGHLKILELILWEANFHFPASKQNLEMKKFEGKKKKANK